MTEKICFVIRYGGLQKKTIKAFVTEKLNHLEKVDG